MSNKRKGIILSGGKGSRLYPSTIAISKQLMPVYDKPMIYYPLSTLMNAKIREILIITTPESLNAFKSLLGNGEQWGLSLEYKVQKSPDGIAQALILGEDFLNGSPSVLVLGDNIFYGTSLQEKLLKANANLNKSTIFGYEVNDPQRYGIALLDKNNKKIIDILEKPDNPPTNLAITGLYFYASDAPSIAKNIKPSKRGELEITELNNFYIKNNKINFEILERGSAWLDTGTHESLNEANNFVRVIEHRQGIKLACLEEIAFNNGWIDLEKLSILANSYPKSSYSFYIKKLVRNLKNEY